MERIFIADSEKCTGCRTCETVCSFLKEGEFNPAKSRIHILKDDYEGVDAPRICQQCIPRMCKVVCPMDAINLDVKTGATLVDADKCNGCGKCVTA